ncbi:MAG: helix-turn-helix domain-containing protein, partial [Chloroflexota bacterium]|nr:helix-turn-helix domain-containing protein [Chloroflexota bacterium]
LVMLRERRIEQREVARRIGVTPPQVSNYVRGVTTISPERERQIRRVVEEIMAERKVAKEPPPEIAEVATA